MEELDVGRPDIRKAGEEPEVGGDLAVLAEGQGGEVRLGRARHEDVFVQRPVVGFVAQLGIVAGERAARPIAPRISWRSSRERAKGSAVAGKPASPPRIRARSAKSGATSGSGGRAARISCSRSSG